MGRRRLLRDLGIGNAAQEIAKKAGVSVRTIASFRSRNQIPGYSGRTAKKSGRTRRKSRIDPFADIVGKVPDRVVAEKAGVTLNAVRNYRASRGIRSSRERARELREAGVSMQPTNGASQQVAAPASPVAAERPVISTKGAFAWRARFENGSEGLVLGDNAVQAAQAAQLSGHGSVLGLERVGSML